MMKQPTLDAPRSTAATSGWRAPRAFSPSRASRRSSRRDIARRLSTSRSAISPLRGRLRRRRRAVARPHRHHLRVAQVDPREAQFQQARALIELVQPDQRRVLAGGGQLDQAAVLQPQVPAAARRPAPGPPCALISRGRGPTSGRMSAAASLAPSPTTSGRSGKRPGSASGMTWPSASTTWLTAAVLPDGQRRALATVDHQGVGQQAHDLGLLDPAHRLDPLRAGRRGRGRGSAGRRRAPAALQDVGVGHGRGALDVHACDA